VENASAVAGTHEVHGVGVLVYLGYPQAHEDDAGLMLAGMGSGDGDPHHR
jgi:hypothetical protein